MRHRHWFLVAAAAAIFYSFILVRLDFYIRFFATYGDSDIHSGTALAVTFVLVWLALEIVHFLRIGSRGKCGCGYSLRGVKCPECGRDIGEGAS